MTFLLLADQQKEAAGENKQLRCDWAASLLLLPVLLRAELFPPGESELLVRLSQTAAETSRDFEQPRLTVWLLGAASVAQTQRLSQEQGEGPESNLAIQPVQLRFRLACVLVTIGTATACLDRNVAVVVPRWRRSRGSADARLCCDMGFVAEPSSSPD